MIHALISSSQRIQNLIKLLIIYPQKSHVVKCTTMITMMESGEVRMKLLFSDYPLTVSSSDLIYEPENIKLLSGKSS